MQMNNNINIEKILLESLLILLGSIFMTLLMSEIFGFVQRCNKKNKLPQSYRYIEYHYNIPNINIPNINIDPINIDPINIDPININLTSFRRI
jgi:hypothetical protein